VHLLQDFWDGGGELEFLADARRKPRGGRVERFRELASKIRGGLSPMVRNHGAGGGRRRFRW
jgi:hypothetical protein